MCLHLLTYQQFKPLHIVEFSNILGELYKLVVLTTNPKRLLLKERQRTEHIRVAACVLVLTGVLPYVKYVDYGLSQK